MLDKRRHSVAVIMALLFFGTAAVAQAALVQGTIQGFIAENAETRGEGINVFGLDGAGLLGQPFVVDFYYRTDIAPVVSSSVGTSDARTIYNSSDAGLDWLGFSLTVNDLALDLISSNRRADILDTYTDPSVSNGDFFQLAVDGGSASLDGSSFRRQLLDITTFFNNDVIDGAALPTTFQSTEIERAFGSATFRINDYDIDTDTRELTYERFVEFNLDVQSIEASVVPIPASIWLFGSALFGLFVTIRNKRK